MAYRFILLMILITLSVTLSAQQKAYTLPSETLVAPQEIQLPIACDLLSPDSVATVMGIQVKDIMVIEPPKVGEQGVAGCFYKWADESTPHAGIFIQVMKNPAYDSYPEYIREFVDSKIENGEAMPGRAGKFTYASLDINGLRAVWCAEQSRFYWTMGSNHLCMLAINRPGLSEQDLIRIGKTLIGKVAGVMLSAN